MDATRVTERTIPQAHKEELGNFLQATLEGTSLGCRLELLLSSPRFHARPELARLSSGMGEPIPWDSALAWLCSHHQRHPRQPTQQHPKARLSPEPLHMWLPQCFLMLGQAWRSLGHTFLPRSHSSSLKSLEFREPRWSAHCGHTALLSPGSEGRPQGHTPHHEPGPSLTRDLGCGADLLGAPERAPKSHHVLLAVEQKAPGRRHWEKEQQLRHPQAH